MALTWKKGFRKIPPKIGTKIRKATGDNIRVIAGKRLSPTEITSGDYSHLDLINPKTEVPSKWEVVPDPVIGQSSKRNVQGWETVRKDLPKYTKYFYHDIQNFGDASRNGWSTVAIPREVYHRDSFPPYLFQIGIEIRERFADGSLGVVFSIDEVFDRQSPTFKEDILFAINLLQENTGIHDVSEEANPHIVFSGELSWELFPPGNINEVVTKICGGTGKAPVPDEETVRERLELFEKFEPTQYLKGLGGNDHYVGAKFADDLVAFENFKHGNALYVLYQDWETLSKKSRSEILRAPTSEFDRIIHTDGWQTRFALLMQRELKDRGIRIRIGRNRTRRR